MILTPLSPPTSVLQAGPGLLASGDQPNGFLRAFLGDGTLEGAEAPVDAPQSGAPPDDDDLPTDDTLADSLMAPAAVALPVRVVPPASAQEQQSAVEAAENSRGGAATLLVKMMPLMVGAGAAPVDPAGQPLAATVEGAAKPLLPAVSSAPAVLPGAPTVVSDPLPDLTREEASDPAPQAIRAGAPQAGEGLEVTRVTPPISTSGMERLWSMQGFLHADDATSVVTVKPLVAGKGDAGLAAVEARRSTTVPTDMSSRSGASLLMDAPADQASALVPELAKSAPDGEPKAANKAPGVPESTAAANASLDPSMRLVLGVEGADPFFLPGQPAAAFPTGTKLFAQPLTAAVVAAVEKPVKDGVSLTLAPEELGRLHMQMVTDGDHLTVNVAVERPETLHLLRSHAEQLVQELRQAGFAQTTLNFSNSGPDRFPHAPPQAIPDPTFDPDAMPTVPSNGPPAQDLSGPSRGLDLRL